MRASIAESGFPPPSLDCASGAPENGNEPFLGSPSFYRRPRTMAIVVDHRASVPHTAPSHSFTPVLPVGRAREGGSSRHGTLRVSVGVGENPFPSLFPGRSIIIRLGPGIMTGVLRPGLIMNPHIEIQPVAWRLSQQVYIAAGSVGHAVRGGFRDEEDDTPGIDLNSGFGSRGRGLRGEGRRPGHFRLRQHAANRFRARRGLHAGKSSGPAFSRRSGL